MRRLPVVLLMLALMLSGAGAAAQEPQRLALLIGNQAYKPGVGALVNPLNDIRLVGDALKAVKFEVLRPIQNASRSAMLLAVHEFASRLKTAGPDAVGFLYYSGHGLASEGENYLVPVDIEEPSTVLLRVQGVKQSEVLAILRNEAPNAAHYLVLDACRNTLQGTRGAGKGFIPIRSQSGVMVAFSTEPGKTASDIGQGSGPYAAALAAELVKPGLDDFNMFHNVRIAVIERTRGDQVPWTEDGIQRRQRVKFGGEIKATPPVPVQPTPSEAERTWPWVKDTSSQAVLENFIKQFSDTPFAAMARARLEELKRNTSTPPPSPAVSDPTPPRTSVGAEAAWFRLKDTEDIKALEAFRRQYAGYDRLVEARIEELKKQQVAVAAPPKAPAPAPQPKPAVAVPTTPPPARCDGVEAQVGNERRCLKPKDTFKDCPDCPEMVVIPKGEFMMGSNDYDDEKPVHKVKIGKLIAVGKFEVTFAEWDACVTAGACKRKPVDRGWGRGNRPVIDVSWDEISKEFLPWVSQTTDKSYRLLTEAEWEYAARAGSGAKYAWGDEIGENRANCDGCGSQWDNKQTAPVGSFQANAFGLHDMHGNAWEWVQDCYKDSYATAPVEGSAVTSGDCYGRVVRGGSCYVDPRRLRSAYRLRGPTLVQGYNIHGFRLARTLSP